MTVEERVKKVVAESLDVADVEDATSFVFDYAADQLDMVELAVALEDEFNISLSDEQLRNVATAGKVSDVVRLVEGWVE